MLSKIIRIFLGIFDILWALVLCFWALATQFALISYVLLGLIYVIFAIILFEEKKWSSKLFFFGIVPVSIVAAINIRTMGLPGVPAYFYTPPKDQIEMTLIYVGIPFILNIVAGLLLKRAHK